MEDREIISLFFERSERAIRELSEKYGRLIFCIASNILGNWEDADECVSDTYLGVWNDIPPQEPNPLIAFVCRIARNIALKKYRANTAQKRDFSRELPLAELENCLFSPSAEEICSTRELGRAIDRFLDTVDEESRIIFLRRYWFSDAVGDIADLLDMTENNVSVKLSRTRNKLRKYLQKEGVIG